MIHALPHAFVKVRQAKQQLEQTGALLGGGGCVAGKQGHREIALLAEPIDRAGIGRFSLAAAFLNGGNASKDFIQVVREAHTLAVERSGNGRRASADAADANLCQDSHTYPSERNSTFQREHARSQFSRLRFA
jgi:hypothetical protein